MNDKKVIQAIAGRIISCRGALIRQYPFFGQLLLRLKIAFSECETAFTDGERIVFDLDFVDRLSDEELKFLMLHELLHVLHKHCLRADNRIGLVYNIACDIVVNSCILQMMRRSSFVIDSAEVMHLTPGGMEGHLYSAEEVYRMLVKDFDADQVKKLGQRAFDRHDCWREIQDKAALENKWAKHKKQALNGKSIPADYPWLKRVVADIAHRTRVDWRITLLEYMQQDKTDYSFTPPDKRYLSCEFILPGLAATEVEKIDEVWICVDTSGSVDGEGLAIALQEIKNAIDQTENMEGYISFFDHQVRPPEPFVSAQDIDGMLPRGGGGTDFGNIFKQMHSFFEEKPYLIIILTDGYADFPKAPEIPVIWGIIRSEVRPPWGKYVKID